MQLKQQLAEIVPGSRVRAREAGAGGDCLFYSVAAALNSMRGDLEAGTHVERSVPAGISGDGGSEFVLHLRRDTTTYH